MTKNLRIKSWEKNQTENLNGGVFLTNFMNLGSC